MSATEIGLVVERSREVNYKLCMSSLRDALLTHYSRAAALNAQAKDELTMRDVHPDRHKLHIICDLENGTLRRLSTVYMWFDALLVHLRGIGHPETECMAPRRRVYFARIYAIYLPAILPMLKLPLLTALLAHAHRTMSKSFGNVTGHMQATDDCGVDVVRSYFACG
ncbi:hypothetical protein EDD16DRAFT_1704093 [Pisolithus croceorrhizus]|nr:hypothetical protein EDD16DRAFT_1704093 [Pisolithus croceorrhizus]